MAFVIKLTLISHQYNPQKLGLSPLLLNKLLAVNSFLWNFINYCSLVYPQLTGFLEQYDP